MSLLKVSEIAHVLRISTQTVRRLIDRGDIPAVRVGSQRRVDADVFATYLRKHEANNA